MHIIWLKTQKHKKNDESVLCDVMFPRQTYKYRQKDNGPVCSGHPEAISITILSMYTPVHQPHIN